MLLDNMFLLVHINSNKNYILVSKTKVALLLNALQYYQVLDNPI